MSDQERTIPEEELIAAFGNEGITITRRVDQNFQATFQDSFGEGTVIGESLLFILLLAVKRQKTSEYWRGYYDLETEIRQLLRELPIAIRITTREQGYYHWQCFEKNGSAPTFVAAVTQAIYALVEVHIRHTADQKEATRKTAQCILSLAGQPNAEERIVQALESFGVTREVESFQRQEQIIISMLRQLPVGLTITKREDGRYSWEWLDARGAKPSFLEVLDEALTHIEIAYIASNELS